MWTAAENNYGKNANDKGSSVKQNANATSRSAHWLRDAVVGQRVRPLEFSVGLGKNRKNRRVSRKK